MYFINYVIYISAVLLNNFLLLTFMKQCLPHRLKGWRTLLAAIIISLAALPKLIFGFDSKFILYTNVVIFPLAVIVMPLVLFGGRPWRRLAFSSYFWGLMMLGDALPAYLYVPHLGKNILLWETKWCLIEMGISICTFVLLGSLSVLICKRLRMVRFHLFYLLFLVFPMSQWILLLSYFFNVNMGFWSIGVALGAGAQIGLLFLMISQERKKALEEELKDVRHTMELEQAHYRAMEERREELARIRHDFNNQLAVIGQLIGSGEKEDAQKMIGKLAEDIDQTKENPYCAVPVINAVLTEKVKACTQAGAELQVELDIPEELEAEPLHLCSIFSNLLDNALRGAAGSEAENAVIRLTSMVNGDYLFIKTVNPSAPPSAPAQGHGRGTRILTDLAERYGGSYWSEYQEGVFTAVVSLLIIENEEK